ncbi:hypothetical protein JCM5350_002381 [Sporobolomyces pararoseus]
METVFDPAFVGRDTSALLGPQTAGWQVGFVVYGVYLTMHVSYLRSEGYGRHATPVKFVIWLVFVLVLAYEVVAFIDNFRYMIILKRTPQDVLLGWAVDYIASLLAGAVAMVVQIFLTIRASVLIRHRRVQLLFLVVMGVCILASFTGSILTCATSFMYYNGTISNIKISFNNSVAIWLWNAAFVDLAISISLLITLKQRIGGLNAPTDSLLWRLIVVSLQTAAYTSVLATAGAVVSLVFKDSSPAYALLHFAFWTPLPPCYAVSLYTTLSTRRQIDEHLGTVYALGGGSRSGGAIGGEGFGGVGPIATREISLIPSDAGMVHKGWSLNGVYSPTIFALWAEGSQRRNSAKSVTSFASKTVEQA